MHALKRLAVIGGDAEARPAFRALQIVLNGVVKPLHLFRPRRILLVNQHWRGKLSRLKQCCDVLEMRANGITLTVSCASLASASMAPPSEYSRKWCAVFTCEKPIT